MIPIEDVSKVSDRAVKVSSPTDPVRVVVQAILAVYLAPVILLVCLIGATAVAVGRVVKVATRLVQPNCRPLVTETRATQNYRRPRIMVRRERSRSIH